MARVYRAASAVFSIDSRSRDGNSRYPLQVVSNLDEIQPGRAGNSSLDSTGFAVSELEDYVTAGHQVGGRLLQQTFDRLEPGFAGEQRARWLVVPHLWL